MEISATGRARTWRRMEKEEEEMKKNQVNQNESRNG
jgi:hypothetical protein